MSNLNNLQAPSGNLLVDSPVIKAVTNAARSTTTATLTIVAHGFKVGQQVTVALLTGPTSFAALNGTFLITGVATDTFTYTTSTSGTITSGAATGQVTCQYCSPVASTTSEVPLKFPGYVDSGADAVALTVVLTDNAGVYRKVSGGATGGTLTIPVNTPFTISGKPGDTAYVISSSGSKVEFWFDTVK